MSLVFFSRFSLQKTGVTKYNKISLENLQRIPYSRKHGSHGLNQLRHFIRAVLRLRKFACMLEKSMRHPAVAVKMNRDAGLD